MQINLHYINKFFNFLINYANRTPTHLVITFDNTIQHIVANDTITTLTQSKDIQSTAAPPRGSLHSIRRGSFDVRSIASDGLRRTSLAKLSALPLEAPITKVCNK